MAEAIILIVDDDRTIVRLCQRLLERAAYQVFTALDPLEALKILEQQKVDLLLSDIRMPIMDGFELISRAKQFQPDLPVLIMTGYGSIENAIQALHRGVDGLILKPFENTAELIQAVQRVLEESNQKRDVARLQALRPLFDVTERLLAETSPVLLEKLILNAVTGMFQASHGGIYRINPQDTCVEIIRTTENKPLVDPEVQQRLIQLAAREGSPLAINANGPSFNEQIQQTLKKAGLEGLLFALVRRNASQFIFCACRGKGNPHFTEADLEMFVILARQAAVAMENARLYSELKNYVRRVEESQRALIQAEKMAAVGRLMASLAHEINNPLQAVRNCLHLASYKGISMDQRFHYLDMTENELERLVSTVHRMLEFYRPGGIEKNPSDLHQIIEKVLALLGPQLKEQKIQVHFRAFGDNKPIDLFPDQIQQVIFNILLNAMDAMEDGCNNGNQRNDQKEVWIEVLHEDRQVRIRIEDAGPGIAEELREHIFEPFISSKQQGTGLGLAVSYGIMERHQGSLSIAPSQYREGACFEMILPVGVNGENG